jgi:hypothetical protein
MFLPESLPDTSRLCATDHRDSLEPSASEPCCWEFRLAGLYKALVAGSAVLAESGQ